MDSDRAGITLTDWRHELPQLTAKTVTLREPLVQDLVALVGLLSAKDASRFGIEGAVHEVAVRTLIDAVLHDRGAGLSFTYVITLGASRVIVGLVQVRRLDPGFEGAEWEITLDRTARGTGAFVEAARLVGSLAFGTMGTHRLESRVLLQNGRANGAMRKLGAVQEGILRRSVRRGNDYLDQVLWSLLKEDWGGHWVSTEPRVH
jgi:ribosomal-protein-alanine N-acetyltransferase